MTHTIHRALSIRPDDFLLNILSSKGINREGSGDKIREIVRRLSPLGVMSFGNPDDGCTLRVPEKDVIRELHDGSNLHMVFGDEQKLKEAIGILKEMDTGLSIVLTGPTGTADSIIRELGLTVDSVHFGAGALNKPPMHPDVEAVVSLCGHMRVSPKLVERMSAGIAAGELDAAEAAAAIGRVCRCGCFNTAVAAQRLTRLAKGQQR